MSVNKVILVGNLGADPEIRYLDGDRVVANFSLATNESYYDREGNKITQTEWHLVEMWDALAKVAEKFLKKGKLVYIEGKIKTDHWRDKDGNDKYTTRIRANIMQMLGGSDQAEKKEDDSSSPEKPSEQSDKKNLDSKPDGFDDLPF